MKSIKAIAAFIVFAVGICGTAYAQTQTLSNQVKIGPGVTFNLSTAQYVSIKPNNQFYIARSGVQKPITLVSITQVTSAPAWGDYAELSDGLYANLSETTDVYCSKTGSVILWNNRSPELIADGCIFAYKVEAFSRAR